MSDILVPAERPGEWTTLGDHERRIRALEALVPCCDDSGGAFTSWSECVMANEFLVMYWPCGETSGNLVDLVNGNELVPFTEVINSTTYPLYGQTGPFPDFPDETAVEFAGESGTIPSDDDRFEYSFTAGEYASLFSGTHAFTVEAWLQPRSDVTGPLTNGRVFEFWDGSAGEVIAMDYSTNNRFSFTRKSAGVGGTAAEEIPLGEYAFIRVTFDGAELKMYVNTNLTDTQATATSHSGNATLSVGNNRNSGGTGWTPFPGRVAHLAFYSAAITDFCDLSGGSGGAASEFMVLTSDGDGGTYWDYPTIEVLEDGV